MSGIKALMQQLGPTVCTYILSTYVIRGCDTTSRLHDIGKEEALNKFITSNDFREQATVFDTPSASTTDASVCLYNKKPVKRLDSLRHNRFCKKWLLALLIYNHLPPTSAAAKYHNIR